ncbi:hypothetical protein GCM10007886_29520 [Methylobacterium gregans]|uniref:Phage tail assembly protein n=1 Tax=Methylobacterium gregans TaxID=374424 RepID=A0AA37HPH2_9HYPH|nr:phage tail assembly protein [Methylobacterium gregans]MDQ0523789.1 hypothetical protein [Methylobacterium gregans]GJD79388.1 hypothetical protein NBEOAGPD_2614 [Methylobacterium gregans]GLS54768.1 hypothetical protein GCM10007886_29520 [Methylobacterium gregans]
MTSKVDTRLTADIKLLFPVNVGGQNYTALTMRRPKTADALAAGRAKRDEMERGIFLLARLCDVAPDVIEELDETDFFSLTEQLESFRGRPSEM